MRLATRTLYSLSASRITGEARHRRARRRGAGGPRGGRGGGVRGGEAPRMELARYAARNENFVLVVREPHNGPGAPQARPPARSGDRGAPASGGVGGSAGAKPPGSS